MVLLTTRLLHHGGGSVGWSGGAAVGAKLACTERTVVSLADDGSFLFSVPSSALWVQRRYNTFKGHYHLI
jgi:acetolactate synthase-1/2/3 large subunit